MELLLGVNDYFAHKYNPDARAPHAYLHSFSTPEVRFSGAFPMLECTQAQMAEELNLAPFLTGRRRVLTSESNKGVDDFWT